MSIEKKKLSRLCYLSKAIALEFEEVEEIDELYEKQFILDFKEEQQYVIDMTHQNPEEVKTAQRVIEEKQGENGQKHKPNFLKKMHRALAKQTHPDHSGNEESFKKMQEAYDAINTIQILQMILEMRVEVDLTLKELSDLEASINKQKNAHGDIKNTLRWAWAQSNKSQHDRTTVQKHMGIDPKKFLAWKEKKGD